MIISLRMTIRIYNQSVICNWLIIINKTVESMNLEWWMIIYETLNNMTWPSQEVHKH